ncbi:penicillin-binding protein [Sphingobacterium spiritivorum]|uniref:Penicillin-binding protein, transpeptidase domain protein n=1 Tax=Sphingobacterium spiritivorum ATCC 33861 TaxID=525373 RepID=D7VTY3_SPHSI|nr:penicillin-binding transpeptidase domain-containing protein [Sphingobacterium spiritivorum]EFK55762.1 penicillin-binding protein, transpeptidase domain protein [Sphingobacterium spiritivorum ATCC 33861]QQT34110.1 PASTA domain-containing protein [Sphingobacterium spiritivorum]WQD34944.1 penicillin-binding transpeptidase domain-containing protein [Sphingobacterium spiritivorum]SUI98688.1 Penicillin-binding protein 2 [Sphingobacterium spiritivorum]
MNIRKSILLRVYLAFGLMVLGALVVFAKLVHLQYVDGGKWREISDSLTIQEREVEAARGNIYSNDGSILATSIPEYDLRFDAMAIPEEEEDIFNSKVDSLAYKLAGFFKDRSARQYLGLLKQARSKKQRYVMIMREVTHQDLKKVKDFPLFKSFKVDKDKYSGGLIVERHNKRILPFTNLAARTIGYKNTKGIDTVRVGLEGAYGHYIDGKSGKRLVQRIAGGVWVPINRNMEVAPVDGSDIISTIDVNMQDMAQRALEKQLQIVDADNGCVILMEVKTGEVRAVANFTRDEEGVFREKFNYAIALSAEPGSTFKLASYLALIDDGKIDSSTTVDVGNGTYKVPGHTIKDSHAPRKSIMSAKYAFEQSSNVAITKLVNTHYKDDPSKFTDKLYSMGLGKALQLQIPGEGEPKIKTPKAKSWSKLSLVQMAYGYELLMTPLQTLTLYNAVANDGKMIAPVFVKEIRHLGNTVEHFQARVIKDKIASEHALSEIRGMMEGTMIEGTGKSLRNPLYTSAGKTGTAQIADGARGYRQRKYQSSFAGYFPAENPKYSMIVVIRNPRKGYYGASTAGPVFKELADMVFANDLSMHGTFSSRKVNPAGGKTPLTLKGSREASMKVYEALGIRSFDWNAVAQGVVDTSSRGVPFVDVRIKEGVVPDVKGMGLIDAMYTMENAGFKTYVSGKGKVIEQSLSPGSKLKFGTQVAIVLN